tara:strand:- start:129 stop:431 length:303 start_codon:yes stop_codon:yes gene_type:complete
MRTASGRASFTWARYQPSIFENQHYLQPQDPAATGIPRLKMPEPEGNCPLFIQFRQVTPKGFRTAAGNRAAALNVSGMSNAVIPVEEYRRFLAAQQRSRD